jgi:hypothetical protein
MHVRIGSMRERLSRKVGARREKKDERGGRRETAHINSTEFRHKVTRSISQAKPTRYSSVSSGSPVFLLVISCSSLRLMFVVGRPRDYTRNETVSN